MPIPFDGTSEVVVSIRDKDGNVGIERVIRLKRTRNHYENTEVFLPVERAIEVLKAIVTTAENNIFLRDPYEEAMK